MTISTYAELQTAVTNWLDRTDLSSRIVEFISLAESRINRDLAQVRMAWSNTALTGTLSSRSIALPTDFIEGAALFLTTNGSQQKLRPFINGVMALRTTNGSPLAWSVNGANIDLDCPCDQAHTFLFRYRVRWQLSDSATTSWLLTNHPDLYLYATLAEACAFTQEEAGITVAEAKYKAAVNEIEEKEARTLSTAPLQSDPALLQNLRQPFDFTYGDLA